MVAVASFGPLPIESIQADGSLSIRDGEDLITVSVSEISERIRRPVDGALAERIKNGFAAATAPLDERDPYQRSRVYREALRSNDLERMASTLRQVYAHPEPEYAEEQARPRLEEAVFGELALALDTKVSTLERRLRSRKAPLTVVLDRAEEVASHEPLVEVVGLHPIGAFAVEKELAVGEHGRGKVFKAKPGIWYGYASDGEMDDGPDRLVVVHHERVGQIEELGSSAKFHRTRCATSLFAPKIPSGSPMTSPRRVAAATRTKVETMAGHNPIWATSAREMLVNAAKRSPTRQAARTTRTPEKAQMGTPRRAHSNRSVRPPIANRMLSKRG